MSHSDLPKAFILYTVHEKLNEDGLPRFFKSVVTVLSSKEEAVQCASCIIEGCEWKWRLTTNQYTAAEIKLIGEGTIDTKVKFYVESCLLPKGLSWQHTPSDVPTWRDF